MSKKTGVKIAIAVFVLFLAAAPLYTFNQMEKVLTSQAEPIIQAEALRDARIEWNGRNGYMTVLSSADMDTVEKVINQIEAIPGVRLVKLQIEQDLSMTDKPSQEEKASGNLTIDWGGEKRNINGDLDAHSVEVVESIFRIKGLKANEGYTLSDSVLKRLDIIGADIFDMFCTGKLTVEDDKIKIYGMPVDGVDTEDVQQKWAAMDGVLVEILMIETEDSDVSVQTMIDETVTENPIVFDSNSNQLTTEAMGSINRIAEILNTYEDVDIVIVGHTDYLGDQATNIVLSQTRAQAVLDELAALGIDGSRMQAEGRGEIEPIASNTTPEGRQVNRRVEISVLEEAE